MHYGMDLSQNVGKKDAARAVELTGLKLYRSEDKFDGLGSQPAPSWSATAPRLQDPRQRGNPCPVIVPDTVSQGVSQNTRDEKKAGSNGFCGLIIY